MTGKNLGDLVDRLLGTGPVEEADLHAMTVKLPLRSYARLRALTDLTGKAKGPLAADILVAAIDDFMAALPDNPVDDPSIERRLMGSSYMSEGMGLRELVEITAHEYLRSDDNEAKFLARIQQASSAGDTEQVLQNGAHK